MFSISKEELLFLGSRVRLDILILQEIWKKTNPQMAKRLDVASIGFYFLLSFSFPFSLFLSLFLKKKQSNFALRQKFPQEIKKRRTQRKFVCTFSYSSIRHFHSFLPPNPLTPPHSRTVAIQEKVNVSWFSTCKYNLHLPGHTHGPLSLLFHSSLPISPLIYLISTSKIHQQPPTPKKNRGI